jgi:hypothetical protein
MGRPRERNSKVGWIGAMAVAACLLACTACAPTQPRVVEAAMTERPPAPEGSDTATSQNETPDVAVDQNDAPDVPPNEDAVPVDDSDSGQETAGTFFEGFDGNTGLDRFDTGMYHRDDVLVADTSWSGDHDLSCGDPSTQRTIRRDRPSESFYLCRDHLMTSVGDTSGYSIAWFAPKETFHGGSHTKVSFDVNVTDLGARQWWEVSIVPVGSPYLATIDWVAETANIATYDDRSVVVGTGPYGNDGNIVTEGDRRDPLGHGHVCGGGAADPEGCESKAIRRPFSITDNRNGTISFDFLGERYTYAGEFPSDFKVYFKDHNYTPDKDGTPVGHTWHWDNISVS